MYCLKLDKLDILNKLKIRTHCIDREDEHHHLSDVKSLHRQQPCYGYDSVIKCIKKIYQADFRSVCY